MKNLLLLLAASGILFAGCKEDSAFGGKPVGNRWNMLTARSWRLVEQIDQGVKVDLKACQLDNIYVFDPSANGYMDEGATKCGEPTPVDTTNPGDTTIIVSKSTIANADNLQYDPGGTRMSFTWEIPGDQRELLINNFGSSDNDQRMEFEEMDEFHFVVRGSEYRNGKLVPYFKRFEAL
jgi:hypothetical protein